MGIDLATSYGWAVEELGRDRTVAESMNSLIDRLEAARPHPDWASLRSLPYSDLTPVVAWLRRTFSHYSPETPLKGLWFGIFNPCRGNEVASDMYVCGAERFVADPHNNSWATGPSWLPDAPDAESEVLAGIYRIAYRRTGDQSESLGNDAEYPLCLAYATLAVRDTLRQLEPAIILGRSESLGIAIGFDEGDFVLLGTLTKAGLELYKGLSPGGSR